MAPTRYQPSMPWGSHVCRWSGVLYTAIYRNSYCGLTMFVELSEGLGPSLSPTRLPSISGDLPEHFCYICLLCMKYCALFSQKPNKSSHYPQVIWKTSACHPSTFHKNHYNPLKIRSCKILKSYFPVRS